jgi:hypothetical protein
MSHHHHSRNESAGLKMAEPIPKPSFPKLNFPLFEKNDLSFISLIKPLLSPNGQKLVDLVLILNGFNGGASPDNPPDLLGLLSQLNISGENNSIKELLGNLLNATNNPENKTNPNTAMLTSLLSALNQKEKPEES